MGDSGSPVRPLREGCERGRKERLGRERRGSRASLPARREVGTAAPRRVPEPLGARGRTVGLYFCGARSRAWLGAAAAAPPGAQAALQSRPRGSARPPLSASPPPPRSSPAHAAPAAPARRRQERLSGRRAREAEGGGLGEQRRRRPRRWRGRCSSDPGGRLSPGVRGGAASPEPGLPAGLSVRLPESSGRGAAEGRAAGLHPRAGRRLRAREPATARVAEPSTRPRRPAAGADMSAQGCAPGSGTRKVC